MTHPDLQYKTIKKIERTKEAIQLNSDWITESLLRNKLYKQFKELAEEIIKSTKELITIKGKYENLGWQEEMEYMSLVVECNFNCSEQDNLQAYMRKLISRI